MRYDSLGYEPYFDPGVGQAVQGQLVQAGAIVPAQRAIAAMLPRQLANPGIVPMIVGKTAPGTEGAGYSPLTPLVFTSATAAAQNMVAQPQEPLGPSRLILDSAWVFALGGAPLLTVTAFQIGNRNVAVNAGAAPIGMFRPDAVGNPSRGIAISPGMLVTVTVAIAALPAVGDVVNVSGALVGATIA